MYTIWGINLARLGKIWSTNGEENYTNWNTNGCTNECTNLARKEKFDLQMVEGNNWCTKWCTNLQRG